MNRRRLDKLNSIVGELEVADREPAEMKGVSAVFLYCRYTAVLLVVSGFETVTLTFAASCVMSDAGMAIERFGVTNAAPWRLMLKVALNAARTL